MEMVGRGWGGDPRTDMSCVTLEKVQTCKQLHLAKCKTTMNENIKLGEPIGLAIAR